MPRQDYKQHRAQNQEPSLRNVPPWQSLAPTATTFVEIGIGVFSIRIKDFCQGEYIFIHHMHLYHIIYKDRT